MVMVCFSAVIARKQLWARRYRARRILMLFGKRLQSVLLMAMLVGPCAAAAVRTPRKAGKLPRAVLANLDRRYPGWQFASPNESVVQLVNNQRPRSAEDMCIGQADFDGNGTIDYAVHIKVGQSLNKTRLIVYLAAHTREN